MKKKNIILWIVFLAFLFLSIDAILKIQNTQISNGEECTSVFNPVCGKINVQCVTVPCDAVEETFSNICEAEKRGVFDIREGECITNFEECIAAGNSAMESYPRQCRDSESGKTFTEIIHDVWRLDNIELRQHEIEGYFACFGCSVPKDNVLALCVDPIREMKQIIETEERYCNSNFEVIEKF